MQFLYIYQRQTDFNFNKYYNILRYTIVVNHALFHYKNIVNNIRQKILKCKMKKKIKLNSKVYIKILRNIKVQKRGFTVSPLTD